MNKRLASILKSFFLIIIFGISFVMLHGATTHEFPRLVFAHDQCNTDRGCNNNNVCVPAHNDGPGRHCVEPTAAPPPPPPPSTAPTIPPPSGGGLVCNASTPADVMLVIDTSNSMQGGNLQKAKNAATAFVNKLATKGNARIGIATFDDKGRVNMDLSGDYGAVKGKISGLSAGGKVGTCLECAIDADKGADDVLGSFGKTPADGHKRHVIILTDGKINRYMQSDGEVKGDQNAQEEKKARDQAYAAIGRISGTTFWIAQYGQASNADWLDSIVKTYDGKGKYYSEGSSGSLDAIYDAIAKELVGSTIIAYTYDDTNQNGSPDTGEKALASIKVDLSDGTKVTSQTTDSEGKTTFKDLCVTNFTLTATPPDTYTPSPENSSTISFTQELGTSSTKNFGFKKTGSEPVKEFTFNFSLALHGLGIAGDNVLLRPTQCQRTRDQVVSVECLSNQSPLHPTRGLTVEMINDLQVAVATASGTMNFSSSSGIFETTTKITSTSATPAGKYTFRFHTPMYLKNKVLFGETIRPGETYTIPLSDMTSSDVDNDNILTILDYNMIIHCYQYPKVASPCTTEEINEVDNDDNGVIDEYNVNLFVRDVSAIPGD